MDLDPNHFLGHWSLGLAYEHAGRMADSAAAIRRAAALAEDNPIVNAVLARAEALAGRHDEARRILAAMESEPTAGRPSDYQRAAAELALGDRAEALRRLESAAVAREPWMVLLAVDPMLSALRGDPRFEALVKNVFTTAGMTARSQILAAVVLAAATYGVLLRIAEAKVEASVGGGVFRLDDRRPNELAAFERLRASLVEIGEQALADRLERLRQDGAIWIAPPSGPTAGLCSPSRCGWCGGSTSAAWPWWTRGPISIPRPRPASRTPTNARSPGSAWPARSATSWHTTTA